MVKTWRCLVLRSMEGGLGRVMLEQSPRAGVVAGERKWEVEQRVSECVRL